MYGNNSTNIYPPAAYAATDSPLQLVLLSLAVVRISGVDGCRRKTEELREIQTVKAFVHKTRATIKCTMTLWLDKRSVVFGMFDSLVR